MAKRRGKVMTLEDLAAMVARGFEETASKEEFAVFQREVRGEFGSLKEDLRSIKYDVSQIKKVLGPLVKLVADMQVEVSDLKTRVAKIERKIGLAA